MSFFILILPTPLRWGLSWNLELAIPLLSLLFPCQREVISISPGLLFNVGTGIQIQFLMLSLQMTLPNEPSLQTAPDTFQMKRVTLTENCSVRYSVLYRMSSPFSAGVSYSYFCSHTPAQANLLQVSCHVSAQEADVNMGETEKGGWRVGLGSVND